MIIYTPTFSDRIIKNRFKPQHRIFVAGGISNCPDWQSEFLDKFKDLNDDVYMFNPRREDFDITNPNMSSEQIEWEYTFLHESNVVIFWFPEETLCPITLFELGSIMQTKEDVYVGCHPNYQRKFDVVKQLSLYRDDINVVFSLDELANQVIDYITEY